ncbi:MAG TPA: SUMF1/EgtB/PvdO family nonheme iron enzyme [Pirellulales bacterium]|jgi:formylglycine-generating enzyme required for sulfatase activity|nr:SUMF1/EgtB/PvdO family nonheme iron enzyme [Pirellulales bacterium]
MQLVLRHISAPEIGRSNLGELLICSQPDAANARRAFAELAFREGPSAFPQGTEPIVAIVVSADPTLDDVLAAEFVQRQLAGEKLPAGCAGFASYAALNREALRPGNVSLETSLKGIFMALRQSAGPDLSVASAGAAFLARWRMLADRIIAAAQAGVDPFNSPFPATDIEFARERAFLKHDREVFAEDVRRGQVWPVQLPGAPRKSLGLYLRNPKSLLFCDWCREPQPALQGKPYLFLAVYDETTPWKWIFSTDPVHKLPLLGLYEQLQAAETAHASAARRDRRWFDGAAFGNTLIAAPKNGTALSDSQVIQIVRSWVHATPDSGKSFLRRIEPPRIRLRTIGAVITIGLVIALIYGLFHNSMDSRRPPTQDARQGADSRLAFAFDEPVPTGGTRQITLVEDPKQFDEGQKWAVVIGCNAYDDRTVPRLNYSVADARLLKDDLTKYCGYPEQHILLMTDDVDRPLQPERNHLTDQMKDWFANCKVGDTALLFFAGHGMIGEDGSGYVMPLDWSHDNPKLTAVRINELRDALRDCHATQKLLILDCCHAGSGERSNNNQAFAPSIEGAGPALHGEGLITLASCMYNETSKEFPAQKHGLFTYYLTKGLEGAADLNGDHIILSSELYDYLCDTVSLAAQRDLHTTSQRPVEIKGQDVAGMFVLARTRPLPASPSNNALAPSSKPAATTTSQIALSRSATSPESNSPPATPIQPGPTITNSIGLKLTLIPAGEFMMGTGETTEQLRQAFPYAQPEWMLDDRPQHRVRITKPFYLGTYAVTLGQFLDFYHSMKHSDSAYKCECEKDDKGGWGYDPKDKAGPLLRATRFVPWNTGFEQTNNHPVVNVSWNDAHAFCQWLSKKEGRKYRLPTEAEWEYAARAGTTTHYYFGDDPETLSKYENVADSSSKEKFPGFSAIASRDGFVFTAPVGSFRPNAFGLYDMLGNVEQWCSDWYSEDYSSSKADDPQGWPQGSERVLRGGTWNNDAFHCRCAFRDNHDPSRCTYDIGFRVVCEQ